MFSKVIGNKRNIRYLSEAARGGKLAHAYIINGEKGSGKKTLAGFTAASLLCESEDALDKGPCGRCPACIKIASGNHPDLVRVRHEKETVLSVDEIRDQVVSDMDIKPFYGTYKIYIIEDAQLMNDSAQNALLKTIEEPPDYGIVFLLTENADALLDTVRSRCIRLDMERLPEEEIVKCLPAAGKTQAELNAAAAAAGGNLGKALDIISGEGASELIEKTTEFIRDIKHADAARIYALAAEVEKDEQADVLDILRKWFRDVLMLKACESGTELYFPQKRAAEEKAASEMSFEDLNNAVAAIERAQGRLKANVKSDAVFEALFLALRRCAGGCAQVR